MLNKFAWIASYSYLFFITLPPQVSNHSVYGIRHLRSAISRSNINALLLNTLSEQAVHIIPHTHQIDGTTEKVF